ncbi:FAD:protein FMN transferase [Ectobacillus ponti]|uniref:FAD:protein FMN transferase n=1 Tax=Ectobacillus ponti TaxID=2961894 RepID=A0AA41X5R5_9BACI|nr:FAD:protein FMN transferase [Ectobacillus ponti]MCP8969434.1 FAD:protein FMN transferase [Ectobacillus ponti]
MQAYSFQSMSTNIQAAAVDLRADTAMQVEALFTEAEQIFSRFRPDSELSRLNQRVDKETAVSSFMFDVLRQAARFHQETDGLFQPGILSALEQAGYRQSIELIRDRELYGQHADSQPVHALPYVLNEQTKTAILHRPIDLGGIVKGWAVDRAAELLSPLEYGFVNAGGDIRIFGTLPQPLQVGIEHPLAANRIFETLSLVSGAVATSSTGKRRWLQNGDLSHHLIDPRTGAPADSAIVSATVTAVTATEADVRAKVTLLLDEQAGRKQAEMWNSRTVLMNCRGEIWRNPA